MTKQILSDLYLVTEEEINACKGQIFRASVNSFYSDGRIVSKFELRLLKRKSCHGCRSCGWVQEYLKEDIENNGPLMNIETIEHGKMYTVEMYDLSTDPETGMVDDFDLRVVEYICK